MMLTVIRAEGRYLNLNGFMTETWNMRFDDDGSFKALGLLNGSGLVLLENGHIDTIIEFRSDDLRGQIDFASSVLDSLDALQAEKPRIKR